MLFRLTQFTDAQPLGASHLFKRLSGEATGLCEIRKDQAKLLCCMLGRDIVVLHWIAKKKDELEERHIRKALRLAKELAESEASSC